MFNLKDLVSNKDMYKRLLAIKGFVNGDIDKLVELSDFRLENLNNLKYFETERNNISKRISKITIEHDRLLAINEVKLLKDKIRELKNSLVKFEDEINVLLISIPNLPTEDTPLGKDETSNILISEFGKLGKGKITKVIPHYEIGVELNLLNFKNTSIMSGSRFWAYENQGAKLVRALENFLLDFQIKKGYKELRLPVIVNADTMFKTGQLPKFEDDLFKIEGRDQFLIPTSEVSLVGYYQNQILDLDKTIKVTTFSQCFRKEAGAGGKDTKGIIRGHQFNKVELVKITKEEWEDREFDSMVEDVSSILVALKLPYQKIRLCGGDLGFSSKKTIDFEVWMPSEKRYREVSSVSTFGNFQGRRAKIKYRDEFGKTKNAFTINGSGLAIDRILASIIENYQDGNHKIIVPEVLVPYMGYKVIENS